MAYDISHIHLTLDDQAYISVPLSTLNYTFENVSIGTHTITAQLVNAGHIPAPNPEASDVISFTVEDSRIDQSIDFQSIPDQFTIDNPFDLVATASSGLPVSFELVSGPATLSGNTITLDGTPGTVVVRATQAGNSEYNPAPQVVQDFNVTEPVAEDQTITFDPMGDKLVTDLPFDINATASSGLAVSFEIVSGPATLSGNTITLDGLPGTVVVKATQAGNAFYNPAPDVEKSFEVLKIDQIIDFDPISNKETTDADFDVVAVASSGLDISFSIVSGPATITGNTISLTGEAGTVMVRATQSGDNIFNPADPVDQSFLVSEPVLLDQTISFDAIDDKFTTDAPFDVSASASSGLLVSFEIVSGPATVSGNNHHIRWRCRHSSSSRQPSRK